MEAPPPAAPQFERQQSFSDSEADAKDPPPAAPRFERQQSSFSDDEADAKDPPPAGRPALDRQQSHSDDEFESWTEYKEAAPAPAAPAAPKAVEAVRVMCRIRPPSRKELKEGAVVVDEDPSGRAVTLNDGGIHTFGFNSVFGPYASQPEVYSAAAAPMVDACLRGMNATIVAYGMTGSGKTHTMLGPEDDAPARGAPKLSLTAGDPRNGIIPRAIDQLFIAVDTSPEHVTFEVRVSFIEVYLENVHDLLLPRDRPLRVREDTLLECFYTDASEVPVERTSDVLRLMQRGMENRRTSATAANDKSSRSHALFIVSVASVDHNAGETLTGTLTLVDLAGSEKAKYIDDAPVKPGAKPVDRVQLMRELQNINRSLLALGNVIEALAVLRSGSKRGFRGRAHVPYRDSTLTKLLSNGFGGNGLTTLIINVSPSSGVAKETLSSLKFGDRACLIKNRVVVNRRKNVAELREMLARANRALNEQTWNMRALEQRLALYRRYCLHVMDEIPNNIPGREQVLAQCPRGAAGRRVFNFVSDFMIALLFTWTDGRTVGRGAQLNRRFSGIMQSDRLWQWLCESEFKESEEFQAVMKSNGVSFRAHYLKTKKRHREERLERLRRAAADQEEARSTGLKGVALLRS